MDLDGRYYTMVNKGIKKGGGKEEWRGMEMEILYTEMSGNDKGTWKRQKKIRLVSRWWYID